MSEHPRAGMAGAVLIALAGLAIAVALSVAASSLSTQPIGLEGEPLRAGERLAPVTVTATQTTTAPVKKQSRPPAKTQTTPTTPTTTAPVVPPATTTAPQILQPKAPTTTEPREHRGGGDPDHDDD